MSETVNIRELNDLVAGKSNFISLVTQGMDQTIVGQKHLVDSLLIALLSNGHVLLEGVPGLAKTLAIKTLAQVIDAKYSRIQFTPDLLPADVTGTMIYSIQKEQFQIKKGPIFANFVLADEINRAPAKVQSALLEAMQEHTVTVMGVSRTLNEPFFVLATQNPIEQDGTYPLPEAQMDRFMFKLIVKNPSLDELMDIVNMTQKTMAEVADSACSGNELLAMRATANQIPVAQDVMRYAMTLCSATHPDSECASEAAKKYVRLGASPRAGQALISAAKVKALLKGRFNVAYSDVNELAYPVLRHRMKMNFEAIAGRVSADDVIRMILDELAKKYKIGSANEQPETPVAAQQTGNDDVAQQTPEQSDSAEQSANEEKGEKKKRRFAKK